MPIPVPGCFTKYEGASDEAQSSSTQEADFSIPAEANQRECRWDRLRLGRAEHFVAVPPERDPKPIRSFRSFTADLHRLADWLATCGVTSIAMESTGVYWIALYEILEARGFQVLLVNARHVKNVPGRKSDVSDCEWLRELHSVGLLRGRGCPAGC